MRCGYRFCALIAIFTCIFFGCGPESHDPRVECTNFGVENVRRCIRLKVSLRLDRGQLSGITSDNVRLLDYNTWEPVSGSIYYGGKRIMFVPDQPLLDSTEYRFEIGEGITDEGDAPLPPFHQDFWTGSMLQVYDVNLLEDYESFSGYVYAISVIFSEKVFRTSLYGGVSLTDVNGIPLIYDDDITYDDEISFMVLRFDPWPLVSNMIYTLEIGPHIYSTDGEIMDCDRDGLAPDFEPFRIVFMYGEDPYFGFGVIDSLSNALSYYERKERCFIEEY